MLKPDGLMDLDKLPAIYDVMHRMPPMSPKSDIKAACPPEITYNDIAVALALLAAKKLAGQR